MRSFAWIILVTGLASPAAAQVINGESTYEDNFAHVPPSTVGKKDDGSPGTDPDPTKARPRDLHERDRN